jgi:mannitol/fructose-specific phosphotransferase system IIA component (Ntr-type)
MRLTDILKPQNVKVPLAATTKEGAIGELVDALAATGDVTDKARVLEAVLERESTRTTGIGNGLAIPHGKTKGTEHLVLAIGKPSDPIDFAAVDGRPVSIVWLLASPPDKTGPHMHALARISRLMTADKFRAGIMKAATAEAVYQLIVKQEDQM